MHLDEVFRIWDRFENSNATEIVFETKDGRFSLKKGGAVLSKSVSEILPVQSADVPEVNSQDTPAQAAETAAGEVVSAPLVGTFYRASAPGADPFIKIGQTVQKGDTVAIIEAMKMMNEITAPCSGTVTAIYVEDETLVEYGQPLVCIGE